MTDLRNLQFHPLADKFPLMEGEDFDALVADIKANGLNEPIVLYEGKILDGRNRYRALLAAGLDPAHANRFTVDAADIVGDDPLTYVISANIHRRHLTLREKRDLITKLIKATPEKSNRQIAKSLKASHHTVEAVRSEMESTGQIAQLSKTIGADGKARKQPKKASPTRTKQAKADKTLRERAHRQKQRDEQREAMNDAIRRFAYKLIHLDIELARELKRILWEGGDPHRLMCDLEVGIDGENLKAKLAALDDGLDIPASLRRVAP